MSSVPMLRLLFIQKTPSLLMVKFKSPSVEWLPPRDKRLLDNVLQLHTDQMQPYVPYMLGAPTCGHHFVVLSPPGKTEPGTQSHSTATCAHPVLSKTSSERWSNSLSPWSSSKCGLPLGSSNALNATNEACRNLTVLWVMSLK